MGYPSRQMLYRWYADYLEEQETGVARTYEKYTEEQKRAAVEHYLEHGRSQVRTIRALGYPGRELLAEWVKELAPEACKMRKSVIQYSREQKTAAVIELCVSTKSASQIAREYDVSRTTIQRWKDELLGGKEDAEMRKQVGASSPKPQSSEVLSEEQSALTAELAGLSAEKKELEAELYRLKLEVAILKGTAEIVKKDPGVSPQDLKNREKAMLIDALRKSFPLKLLFASLQIAKSSYFYQHGVLRKPDKYATLREKIRESFDTNKSRYGYRRIHAEVTRGGEVVSEKVVLRLMNDANLNVIAQKSHKYNSYQGEISPEVPNILKRDFHAEKPNEKWLTDIT